MCYIRSFRVYAAVYLQYLCASCTYLVMPLVTLVFEENARGNIMSLLTALTLSSTQLVLTIRCPSSDNALYSTSN